MNSTRHSARGAALIIVLAMLVLVAVVVIGFFARSVTLRKATANERASVSARHLADTAVNLVQAQIDHASTFGSGSSWASQPGAIRLFNTDGSLNTIYRLYSSRAMTATAAADLADDLPPAGWEAEKALWVDINAPVTISFDLTDTKRFPIVDPSSLGVIEGFSSDGTAAVAVTGGASADRSLPMPVRWLYVLQDGKVVSPVGAGGTTVSVAGASAANPIIGRIAFWADDETSRVNINTAAGASKTRGSEGIFWDTPRFDAPDERRLAIYQPASGEYQRYPGHPGTTTLGKVFPNLKNDNNLKNDKLLALTPRYRFGGTEAATVRPSTTGAVPSKTERLYSSVGELLYTPDRTSTPGLDAQQLEGAKFLLTAHSRSPEVTLFGSPRVSVWPVNASAAKRTAPDRLLAHAATINGAAYYFTRSDSQSSATDIGLPRNGILLDYLDELTSTNVPGWGGNFSTKYPDDRRDILTKIFDYVRITNLQDPQLDVADRYAATFPTEGIVAPSVHPTWATLGFGRSEVLADAGFLLVGVGEGEKTVSGVTTPATPVLTHQAGTAYNATNPAFWADHTEDVPREPAANKVAVQALFLMSFFNPALGWAETRSGFSLRVRGLDSATLDGVNLGMPADEWIFCDPRQGNAWPTRTFGGMLDARKLLVATTTDPLGRLLGPGGANAFPFYSRIIPVDGSAATVGFSVGTVTVELYSRDGAKISDPARLVSTYTLDFGQLPGTIPIPKLARHRGFGLTGIAAADGGYQFDRFRLLSQQSDTDLRYTGPKTVPMANRPPPFYLVEPDRDVYYTLAPGGKYADYRMLARKNVPGEAFTPHPNANGVNRTAFLGMLNLGWQMLGSGPFGKLVKDADYYQPPYPSGPIPISVPNPNPAQPSAPSGLNGAFAADDGVTPGDWDNAMGIVSDGPYINKPDDGNQWNIATGTPFFDDKWYGAQAIGEGLFSPNRMIPSAGMLGSIPTGVISGRPWQTLLFRPGPSGHKGGESPRDHLLLDLFWMPVAEPYAISEPFSTDGKVNLNYQILPFTYITRRTALLSALDSERVAKVPKGAAAIYKKLGAGLGTSARLPLNLDDTNGTLRQFEEKFAANDIFRSATEICDIFLVPEGLAWANDAAARAAWYGDDFALVGDNTRERPYANLLGRLTTKSNTFTVYSTTQALKSPPGVPDGTWDESRGVVLSEYRDMTTLERYIDPNAAIPDYAADPAKITSDPLDNYYNWRVIGSSQFAP